MPEKFLQQSQFEKDEQEQDERIKDIVSQVLALPDNRSEALREQLIDADTILYKEIKKRKLQGAMEIEFKKLEEMQRAVISKFNANGFKI